MLLTLVTLLCLLWLISTKRDDFTISLRAKELQRNCYWKQYLAYVRSLIKRENNKCWIILIETSIRTIIIPTFLKFRTPIKGCCKSTVVHNLHRRLLKGELMKVKRTLYELERKISDKHSKLKQVLHHHVTSSVTLSSRALVHRVRVELLSTQKKELENLSKQQKYPLFNVYDTVKLFQIPLTSTVCIWYVSVRTKKTVSDKLNEK